MKNKNFINNELDLIEFSKVVWEKKIKILIIVLIFLISGFIYIENKEKSPYLKFSLTIENSKQSEFFKFLPITKYLEQNSLSQSQLKELALFTNYIITPELVIKKFKAELLDFEEINQVVKKRININDKKIIKTQDYFSLIELKTNKESNEFYVFNFIWDNEDEVIEVFNDVLNLTLLNLEKNIYNEIETLLRAKKNYLIVNDSKRIEFLKEQREIAKEMGLEENKIKKSNNFDDVISDNTAYYLRGYKAIDKEIELIRNRKYEHLKLIYDELNLTKKIDTKWVSYNMHLIQSAALEKNNDKVILILSLVVGIITAILYAYISIAIKANNKLRN